MWLQRQSPRAARPLLAAAERDVVLVGPVDLLAVTPRAMRLRAKRRFCSSRERLVRAGQDPLRRALEDVRPTVHPWPVRGRSAPRSAPVPITATRRSARSCSCSQRAEWKQGPAKDSESLDVGHRRRREGPDGGDEHIGLAGAALGVGEPPAPRPCVPAAAVMRVFVRRWGRTPKRSAQSSK